MGVLSESWQRARAWWRRREVDDRLDDELRFHVEQQTAKNIRAGMTPDQARRHAIIRLGGIEQTRERTRDEFRATALEHLARDLRFGARALRRAPALVAVVVITLGLGIGSTTAMVSVIDGVLLAPLPYPDQDRLVVPRPMTSAATYFGFRDHTRTFDAIGHWDWDSSPVTVTGSGEPESVPSLEVTHEVLPILGATPAAGRGFTAADDTPGAAPTVMISHGYWQRRFGGTDPVGRTLVVEGIPREIIGVLPRWFRFFEYDADVYYPLQLVRAEARFPSGDGREIARLKQGVTLAEANADVARMIPLLWEEFNPGDDRRELPVPLRVEALGDVVVGDLRDTLWILMGTIALLLLIACANVANLMLVRSQARRPELMLRSALGAGRMAIARVVLAESVWLGLAGAVAGIVVAYLSLPFFTWLAADELPEIATVTIDLTSVVAAGLMGVAATMICAAAPVVQLAMRAPRQASMLHGGRAVGEERGVSRTRQLLLIGQVATALVLLVGAGLMVRTFDALRRVEPGFRAPQEVQTFRLTIPRLEPLGGDAGAANRARLTQTQRAILERIHAIGGVRSAGFVSGNDGLPLDGDGRQVVLVPFVDGRAAEDGQPRTWEIQSISPGLVETMQTAVLAGRSFVWDDVENERPVMMISASLARKEFGSPEAAIGRRLGAFPDSPGTEIVGVIEDVHHDGLHRAAPPTVLYPPRAVATSTYVVRTARAGDAALLRDLQRAIWQVHGDLSTAGVQTLEALYTQSLARTRMSSTLLALAGGLAFLLAIVGIYGIVSYAVGQRRREIGLRLALGAPRRAVLGLFVRHAVVLVGVGVCLGLAAAMLVTRALASQLYGVSPLDMSTHVTMAAGLVVAGGLSSYLSASRGAGVDPADALKGE